MLNTDEKIAKFFFAFGLLLALGSMVLGPLDIRSWSIACGVTASFVALAGMFFALQSWNEPDEVFIEQPVMTVRTNEQALPEIQQSFEESEEASNNEEPPIA
ncbi:MAG: hypothetical protein E7L17_05160 [Clostridium sp.]|uniref:hypothetical protein n=1 Tax=Clostridium sp. TaxID=1506 RepID=UPI002910EA33|nr:hypothetical protein [Clostridium sp.]MDU7337488.1 hypothetical protein [Clostridium sp.]